MVKAATAERHPELDTETFRVQVGKKIRAARQQRGMTLAQLGGEDLSKSFLSLVESGRSRISLRALGIVAQRLELPMGYFLDTIADANMEEGELALDRAEAALLRHEQADALRILDAAELSERDRPRALFLRGWALVAAGTPRDAVPVLEEGLALAQERRDLAIRTRLRYTLGSALYNMDNYDEALVHFRQALSEAVQDLEDPVLLGKITVAIGHLLYIRNDVQDAIEHYARARDLFGTVSDLGNLASVYSGLSLAYKKQGDSTNALHYSKLSLGAFHACQQLRETARELNNMAMRYKDLGDLEAAFECAVEAVQRAREADARDVEAMARSTLALVHLKLGRLEEAAAEAEAAVHFESTGGPLAKADAWLVQAELADRSHDYVRSDELYQQALDALREMGRMPAYMDAATAYSEALQRRGETHRALQLALSALQSKPRRSL